MPRKRMTLPKKKEDLEKIVEEVEETHHHEHEHHHHHHHGDLEDTVTVLELLVDSLGANVRNLDARTTRLAEEVARIYRVLAWVVEALAAEGEEERRRALERALEEVGGASRSP
ncbi:MAG: hypothetical protein GSR84_00665 [Desulfurococcales archaeon]|nr:hypothetical protein [Desulfurococcales archaeon]